MSSTNFKEYASKKREGSIGQQQKAYFKGRNFRGEKLSRKFLPAKVSPLKVLYVNQP